MTLNYSQFPIFALQSQTQIQSPQELDRKLSSRFYQLAHMRHGSMMYAKDFSSQGRINQMLNRMQEADERKSKHIDDLKMQHKSSNPNKKRNRTVQSRT
jgi:hypothetical protein